MQKIKIYPNNALNMKSINFDEEYVDLILSGRKKSTIRKGIKSYEMGKIVYLTASSKPFAKARVKKAVVKRVKELNDDDAIKDGFESKEDLIKALKRIYGKIDDADLVTVIHFELI